MTLDESKYIAQILESSGADIISVSAGIGGDRFAPKKEDGRLCYAHLARGIKKSVKIPVIGVGNMYDLADAEKVLQDGDADLAAMGRALVADPYLVVKTADGKPDVVQSCIHCGNCLSLLVQSHLTCSVNKSL